MWFSFHYSRSWTIRGWANVFSFPKNPSICPVLSLKKYLAIMAPLRHADAKSLFVSLIKPYRCVTSHILARWILQLVADADIDTDIFEQHSTCSALAAWVGKTLKLSVDQICKTTSWSVKSTTFRKFYYRVALQTQQI